MDKKAAAFVEQFSSTLFAQWTEKSTDKELFWNNQKFLHQVLEEGIAKLPKVPVKGHLTRELPRFVELLRAQLHQKYTEYQTERADADASHGGVLLMNEEDVERALATSTSDEQAKIGDLLALDATVATQIKQSIEQATQFNDYLAAIDQCAAQLRVLQARRYESIAERDHKRAFYNEQIVRCVDAITRNWCSESRGKWNCSAGGRASTDREKLRVQLQTLVAADLLAAASHNDTQPWTWFFRPQVSAIFGSRDLGKARAGVYGSLLALAVAYPVVHDDSDSDSTSDDSSSSDDDDNSSSSRRKLLTGKRGPKKIEHVDCVEFAKQVGRQITLASGAAHSSDWFLAVLSAFHRFEKPIKFIADDDDDDDDDGLDATQKKALLDVRADLYARAFAASQSLWQERQHEPLALLEALLTLRHAAEFMRVERKQTVAAITTATSQLVGVALPSIFWKWLTHVKKMYAGEHPVVQSVMKKLTKNKTDKKMANVLMQESTLTLAELAVLVEHFALFLAQEKEKGHFVVARGAATEAASHATEDEAADAAAVFFVDNEGGKKRSAPTASESKSARKREKTTTE